MKELTWGQPGHSTGGRASGSASAASLSTGLSVRALRQRTGLDEPGADDLGGELADAREVPLALDRDAQRPHLGLDERLQLLDDQDPLHRLAEAAHQVPRQGVGDAQLEHAGAGGDLLHVGVGRPERDHAEVRAPPLPADQLRGLEPGPQPGLALDEQRVAQAGVDREHDVLGRILDEAARRVLLALSDAHQAARVREARGAAHDHGSVETLAQLEGEAREIERLLGVGGLQHRNVRELAEEARVLLVLRAVDARIVADHQHQAPVDADVGHRHQRVGRDVQAHVLHGRECAHSGEGGPDGHVAGHLLVGRPLRVQVFGRVLGQALQDLGARRSRVGRRHPHARLPGAPRDRLVPHHRAKRCVRGSPRHRIGRRH